jgi:integrase
MISQSWSLHTFLASVYVPSRLEISPQAVRQIEVAIRQVERFAGRTLSVHDLDEDLLRRFLADFRQSHAPSTTNARRRDLLAIWQCAWDEGLVDRPPRRKRVRRAKDHPRVPEAWTKQQVAAILEASAGDRWPIGGLPAPAWWLSFLSILYDCGARVGEALAVRPLDLSIESRWVIFRATKTGRERFAPLHPDTADACRLVWDDGREFVWPLDITRKALDDRFKKILRRAGVPYRPGRLFRLMRITSGSLIEAAGGDGSKHLGNGRQVFLKHYLDPRVMPSQLDLLPRPKPPQK